MREFADGTLTLALEGEIARLTLNRPASRNALTEAMWRAVPLALRFAADEPEAKILTLQGAAGHFASGADIAEFEAVWRDRTTAAAYSSLIAAAVDAVEAMEKPVVALIQGACVGGGLALALACDVRYAASDARFGVTPAKLGLIYSLSDTRRLAGAVGLGRAKELLFTGRIVDAAEAYAAGLVEAIFPAEAFEAQTRARVGQIAAASQWAVRSTKRIAERIRSGQLDDDEASRNLFLDAAEGVDFQEGRRAFLEKRPPRFTYR